MQVWIYDTYALDQAMKERGIKRKHAKAIMGKEAWIICGNTMHRAYLTPKEMKAINQNLGIAPEEFAYKTQMPPGIREKGKWSWEERFKHQEEMAKNNRRIKVAKKRRTTKFKKTKNSPYILQISASGHTKWSRRTQSGKKRRGGTC